MLLANERMSKMQGGLGVERILRRGGNQAKFCSFGCIPVILCLKQADIQDFGGIMAGFPQL
jgi:hypothetical protein